MSAPEVVREPGVDSGPARRGDSRGRWWWAAGLAVAAALLFTAYLRLSNTYPEDSDQANLGLQAWDMLHGNLLLHGWVLSDVSFYTTELPQYMLLELIGGLNTGTFHAAAAMTYTLTLLLAAMLARGRATGRRGVARALIAGGIMLAPQLGFGVFILLLTVGHIGTSVPLLVTWLVLDRARPRWQLAVLAGILLTWARSPTHWSWPWAACRSRSSARCASSRACGPGNCAGSSSGSAPPRWRPRSSPRASCG